MYDLPLNAVRAFAIVHREGGIRAAARTLSVTHSSVSRHVRELEAWVGVPLIEPNRSNRALEFTEHGRVLGLECRSGLEGLMAAVASVREIRPPNAVTVSTTPSFAARWLLPRMSDFSVRHPWIELSVVAQQAPGPLSEQGADVAIRMGKGPWPDMDCEPLMDDELYPVVARSLCGTVTSWSDRELTSATLLHDRDPNAAWGVWRTAFGPGTLDVRRGPRFVSSDLVLRAAGQGLGVALARDRLAREEVANGSLVRPFGDRAVAVPNAYWIVTQPREIGKNRDRHAVRILVDWLKAMAG